MAVDPTKNVRAVVKAEAKRQDQLRDMEHKALRRELASAVKSIRREVNDFRLYLKELARAETKRINAIRKVDVGAVAVANTAAENRATTLAGQVNAAKDAQVVSMKAETDPIRKDIGDLRQSQWTIAGGKDEVREGVVSGQAASHNTGMWIAIGVSVLAFASTSFLSLISIAVILYINKK
jgi:hypothetical protein